MQKTIASSGCSQDMLKRHPQGRHRFFQARYWFRDLILAALTALIVAFFFYQPVQVEGSSMMPRLENNERVFVNKVIYHLEPIHRGDIIVFRYPLDPRKSFIKRVVGLPGDWVSIKDGHVYVNGRLLKESYLPPSYLGHDNCAPVHVAPHHYYVLGDHRDFSDDSRTWGTVDQKYIYGEAAFVYWPLNAISSLH
ncbi:MAG: signal peptidase I [Acidobacteria bacterium]|nr:signal peptidase I [Acidobacteriota bacterium]